MQSQKVENDWYEPVGSASKNRFNHYLSHSRPVMLFQRCKTRRGKRRSCERSCQQNSHPRQRLIKVSSSLVTVPALKALCYFLQLGSNVCDIGAATNSYAQTSDAFSRSVHNRFGVLRYPMRSAERRCSSALHILSKASLSVDKKEQRSSHVTSSNRFNSSILKVFSKANQL